MSLISDLQQIEPAKANMYILLFLSTISPGFLLLSVINMPLVISLDVLKLTILSLAIMLPILAVNLFALFAVKSKEFNEMSIEERKQYLASVIFDSSALTFLFGYISIFAMYFIKHSLNTWMASIAILETILLFSLVIISRNRVKDGT